MKQRNKTILFLLPFVLFIVQPFAFAQEKKSQPLPDVWEREFVDYLDDEFLFINPIGEDEVLVHQPSRRDQYGEPVRDAKGNLISLKESLLFFQGKIIPSQKETYELRKKWGIEGLPKERINSCEAGGASEFKHFPDGGAIRWVNEVVKTGEWWKGGWRTERGGYHKSRHTTYYNVISVLERTDGSGNHLWRKVYLYFHPWWGSQAEKFVAADTYSFYYFKLGCLSLIDERRLFLHFSGRKTIYRLDDRGLPRTNDRNLIILDYSEYQRLVKEVLDRIDNAKIPSDVDPNPQHGSCLIKSRLKDGSVVYLGDYDYTGEVLARRFGFDVDSREVKRVRESMFKRELRQCAEAYYKWVKE